jgi:uncharacterized protein (DUF433 family)
MATKHAGLSAIRKTPGVVGGDACVRDTRIAVWMLVEARRQGQTDADLLEAHPDLSQADLDAAWEYFDRNRSEVERALWQNEACMFETDPPAWFLEWGRRLGFADGQLREAFDPHLSPGTLEDAWRYVSEHRAEVDAELRRYEGR